MEAEEKDERGKGRFKVHRWNDQFVKEEEWRWVPIPTYPDCESAPFPTKEAAKAAGEAAGRLFMGYVE